MSTLKGILNPVVPKVAAARSRRSFAEYAVPDNLLELFRPALHTEGSVGGTVGIQRQLSEDTSGNILGISRGMSQPQIVAEITGKVAESTGNPIMTSNGISNEEPRKYSVLWAAWKTLKRVISRPVAWAKRLGAWIAGNKGNKGVCERNSNCGENLGNGINPLEISATQSLPSSAFLSILGPLRDPMARFSSIRTPSTAVSFYPTPALEQNSLFPVDDIGLYTQLRFALQRKADRLKFLLLAGSYR